MAEYQLFDMCPFTMASIGGGGSFGGVGSESYTWTHSTCLKSNCRLWTYKVDEKGEIFAEGCSLQFIGLNKNEISKNFEIKNKIIAGNDSEGTKACPYCGESVKKAAIKCRFCGKFFK
ncbi:MAG: zinc ribbon domain-containing protein [Candidatus Omnitrophota bacterium]